MPSTKHFIILPDGTQSSVIRRTTADSQWIRYDFSPNFVIRIDPKDPSHIRLASKDFLTKEYLNFAIQTVQSIERQSATAQR